MKWRAMAFAVVLSGAMVSLLAPHVVLAKGGKGGSKSAQPKTPPPPQTETPPPTPAAPASTQPSELATASTALQAAQKKAIAKYESSPEWTAAATELETDRAAFEAVHTTAVGALKTSPDYQKALDASAKAQKELDDQRSATGASSEDLTNAANKAMAARSAVSQMEMDVSSKDPKQIEAKAKLAKATTAMADLRKGEKAAIDADPDYQAAKKDYDDAKAKHNAK